MKKSHSLVSERNINLITSHSRVQRKITIEKAILIAEISIIGWLVVWIFAWYWLTLRNAEKNYFAQYGSKIIANSNSREINVLKRNTNFKILITIYCIPIYGAVIVFIITIFTIGLLPLYLFIAWRERIVLFNEITKSHDVESV